MPWPILNLILAALAFPVALIFFIAGNHAAAVPAAVAAIVFGLEWAGIPLISRTVELLRGRRER